MSVLRVENLSKRYGKKQVLKGITCEFHTGINALLGPNGAGKTTIMNCISGVIKKSGGSVTLDGQDVFEMGEKYREKLSYQFQYQPFYPSYTAHEFLRFSALLKGMPEPLIEDEIRRVLRLVNLSENLDDKIKSFSGGMKQRLAIARAILKDAPVVILDEATASMDAENENLVQQALSVLLQGKTVLVIAHRMRTIANVDKVVVLEQGRVAETGTPEELLNQKGLFYRLAEAQTVHR